MSALSSSKGHDRATAERASWSATPQRVGDGQRGLTAGADTGCGGVEGPVGLTGVTFGYMKWCGRICPNRRAEPAIPYTGASVIFGTQAPRPAASVRPS